MAAGHRRRLRKILAAATAWMAVIAGAPLAAATGVYHASIIIDDLGQNLERVEDMIATDIPLTLAILPGTPYAEHTAHLAKRHDKEIMLHLPMQSVRHHHRQTAGTLTLHMSKQAFVRQLKQNLEAVPDIKGINNHMGSLMTRHPGYMSWLMQTLAELDELFFVDSRTTEQSVAARIAREYRVPSLQRDVFLDPEYNTETLDKQFQRFIDIARERGTALAIAHPHPLSIQYLLTNIPRLAQHGIRLVPVSELIRLRQQAATRHPEEESEHVTCTGSTCAGM